MVSEKLPELQTLQGSPGFSRPSALYLPFGQKASQAIDVFSPANFVIKVEGNLGARIEKSE